MPPKFFVFFLVALFPVFGSPVSENDLADEISVEDSLRDLLERLRKIMKEGIPEEGVPPMEPLRPKDAEMDFLIGNTTLEFYLKDVVIRNLSDFVVENLKVTLFPKQQLVAGVLFPQLSFTGWHKIRGNLFGEIPLNDSGTHRVFMENATVSADAVVRPKAGVLQISDLKADFDIQRISVFHKSGRDDGEKEIPEAAVKHVLDRVRSLYLLPLLNTAKIYLNDLLLRLQEEEILGILSGKTTAIFR